MTHIFLGVDGGGTHTRTVICDETGQILGVGHAGPSGIELIRDASCELKFCVG